jgi:hypothetical protein
MFERSKYSLEHSCYGSTTRTLRMITDIIKIQMRENLKMIVKKVKSLVRQKFFTVELSYNKI